MVLKHNFVMVIFSSSSLVANILVTKEISKRKGRMGTKPLVKPIMEAAHIHENVDPSLTESVENTETPSSFYI